ncbi:MAG: uroporphyrinogen decarboxylase family protein, partial [Clostridia bacterium]|nr:uroporphyrinogen decarboxylase family protein [Clostridia bacterium]
KLGSDCCWIHPEGVGGYKHPQGKPVFDVLGGKKRISLSQDGVFANCEDVSEVDAFDWPDEKYFDYEPVLEMIDRATAAGQAVLSGSWSCFFHNVSDFFGMENYFVKMYTDPAVVEAVTEHVVDFYLRVNERLFEKAADKIDLFFFGNDFGSQRDTLISPEMFDRFVMPSFVKFTDQAHRYGLKVLLHSCGSIYRVIPRLIDAGVDALHPIQAQAANMDAQTLAREFNGKIIFVGGVDTQRLLPNGTPRQVKEEVYRLRDLFGPNYVVSPSHESILPDVPWENVQAMAEAAAE